MRFLQPGPTRTYETSELRARRSLGHVLNDLRSFSWGAPRYITRWITVPAPVSIYRRQESVRTPEAFPETNPKKVPPSAKHRLASVKKAPTLPAML
jgi:hypothetical protein